ncbi:serine/arginine repetitive matrix protein 5-like [Contarinia nasturtii]|uniref:serine/arginine repetitive matrix protein 5-like n=1 Tax=Contarinia nasturtii TaxID=265458 RepID=UPI0012D3F3F3|nr:serine/arginine repetitive matrix protein 5-like [Contarinia nasturtii]
MSSIGKVHLNGSTVLSLNDRFTIMQKQGGGGGGPSRPMPPRPRARSRSRSRSRYVPQMADVPISPRVSIRNRSLLQQLDQKHKLRVALKLKRKSMKIRPQNAIGVRGRRQLIRPSALLMNTTRNARRRLPRSNSMAKQIATIKADLIKNVKRVRRLTRSNSTLNLSEQLGVRGRPRLRRNNPIGERAASRPRGRSASRNRANLIRTNSKQNLRGRSASRQRQQQGAPIRLKRSNSRLNLRGQGQAQQGLTNQRRQQRSRSQSRSNVRRNTISVNARLGVRRQNAVGPKQVQRQQRQQRQPNRQGIRKVQRGRIVKRPITNARNGNGAQQRQQQPQQQRGRLRSRVRNGGQPGNRKGGNQQRQRGQSRQRGNQIRGRPQKKIGKREPPKSKEQLDAELDQYMVNTKSSLDQEMSIYKK